MSALADAVERGRKMVEYADFQGDLIAPDCMTNISLTDLRALLGAVTKGPVCPCGECGKPIYEGERCHWRTSDAVCLACRPPTDEQRGLTADEIRALHAALRRSTKVLYEIEPAAPPQPREVG
jgi:hypothetical protein